MSLIGHACPPYTNGKLMDEHSLLLCRSLTDPREISYNFVFGPPGTSLPARLVAIPKDNRNYSGLLAACGGSPRYGVAAGCAAACGQYHLNKSKGTQNLTY